MSCARLITAVLLAVFCLSGCATSPRGLEAALMPVPVPCPSAYAPRPDEPLNLLPLLDALDGPAVEEYMNNRDMWVTYALALRLNLDACK